MMLNKSPDEVPWNSLLRTLEPALKRISRRFRQQHRRTLAVGSPARVASERGDAIRFPIEVHGGDREYAVATVYVYGGLKRFYDEGRLEQIARDAMTEAEKYPTEPPAKPGALILNYP